MDEHELLDPCFPEPLLKRYIFFSPPFHKQNFQYITNQKKICTEWTVQQQGKRYLQQTKEQSDKVCIFFKVIFRHKVN